MCAACSGHAHVVETLLQHGANVDMTTEVSVLTVMTTEVTMNVIVLNVTMLTVYIDHCPKK